MRRRALLTLSLLSALAGCERPQVIKNVPISLGGTCRISVGEPRANVLLRCGGPCATLAVPDGVCDGARQGPCENRCDVYQDVEVCYANEKVVMLDRLDRVSGRQQWCFWPDPQAQQVQAARPPR